MVISSIKGVDLPEGEKKKIGDDGRQECSTEYDRSKPLQKYVAKWESTFPWFRGCFGTTAAMCVV